MRMVAYESSISQAEHLRDALIGFPRVRSVECYRSGRALVTACKELNPDVLFLDADGFEFERITRELNEVGMYPLVVLCSNLPEMAAPAFDMGASDFILRPVNPVRLEETVRRLDTQLREREAAARIEVMTETIEALRQSRTPGATSPNFKDFWIKQRNEIIRVPQSEIIWIEAARGYVYFHLQHRQLLHRISMRELEETLDPSAFLRIHRSGIINTRALVKTLSDKHGVYAVELNNGSKVRIGRKYRPALTEFMVGFSPAANESRAQPTVAA
ncbi:LytTR family DNA-binding domain-containing protein [Maricaulis sp.]|uniref:LytR/AlgR family response regulator transcription factor n=1 Tax=unclassified Maricaulis TaxID=2632371 RepID=UPI001B00DC8A|nr:LytTR family DNA-binding domain-containing protein [Maricaulis sp.]MBO6796214.1 response regulator transcription factor [Maricaulis sp.]